MALEKLKSVIGKLYRSSNNNSFPYYFHIPKPETGRRFVIADIHGCYQSFKELIKKIELRKEDQLFLLGDFVDRGPNSSGVFNVIFSLLKNEFQVFPLRGNHEQMLIELAIQDENLVRWSLEKNNASDLMCGEGHIRQKYIEFCKKLPYYYILDDYYLVHAGFNFNSKKPFKNYEDMIWMRGFWADKIELGKKVVHGHTPVELDFIKNAIDTNSHIIPLDNGCVYEGEIEAMGKLLCLNLDTMELHEQENIDFDQ